jgi:hypothetical protein
MTTIPDLLENPMKVLIVLTSHMNDAPIVTTNLNSCS